MCCSQIIHLLNHFINVINNVSLPNAVNPKCIHPLLFRPRYSNNHIFVNLNLPNVCAYVFRCVWQISLFPYFQTTRVLLSSALFRLNRLHFPPKLIFKLSDDGLAQKILIVLLCFLQSIERIQVGRLEPEFPYHDILGCSHNFSHVVPFCLLLWVLKDMLSLILPFEDDFGPR